MSARQSISSHLPEFTSTSTQCLVLPADSVHVRKNGIEFRSKEPFRPWTEMTLSLQRPGESKRVNCTGVIVACDGNAYQGYTVLMLFTSLSRQSQTRLMGYS